MSNCRQTPASCGGGAPGRCEQVTVRSDADRRLSRNVLLDERWRVPRSSAGAQHAIGDPDEVARRVGVIAVTDFLQTTVVMPSRVGSTASWSVRSSNVASASTNAPGCVADRGETNSRSTYHERLPTGSVVSHSYIEAAGPERGDDAERRLAVAIEDELPTRRGTEWTIWCPVGSAHQANVTSSVRAGRGGASERSPDYSTSRSPYRRFGGFREVCDVVELRGRSDPRAEV